MRDWFYYKFWVYILSSRSGTLYVGITGYLNRRITQHKIDTIEGFTRSIIAIVWSITRVTRMYGWPLHVRNSSSAGGREKKIFLIEKLNPRWQDLAENWNREMRLRGQSLGKIP